MGGRIILIRNMCVNDKNVSFLCKTTHNSVEHTITECQTHNHRVSNTQSPEESTLYIYGKTHLVCSTATSLLAWVLMIFSVTHTFGKCDLTKHPEVYPLFKIILSDIRLVEEPTEDDVKMYNNNDYIDDDLTNIEGIY